MKNFNYLLLFKEKLRRKTICATTLFVYDVYKLNLKYIQHIKKNYITINKNRLKTLHIVLHSKTLNTKNSNTI